MFKGTTRMAKAAAAVAAVLALTVTATASAGKPSGGGSSTSSISLAVPAVGATSTTTSSWPRYGDFVRFNVSTTATTTPFVNLNCYQGGTLVAVGWAGYFEGALGTGDFGLYSPQWTGGAASCTANLEMYTSKGWKLLASTSFDVAA